MEQNKLYEEKLPMETIINMFLTLKNISLWFIILKCLAQILAGLDVTLKISYFRWHLLS